MLYGIFRHRDLILNRQSLNPRGRDIWVSRRATKKILAILGISVIIVAVTVCLNFDLTLNRETSKIKVRIIASNNFGKDLMFDEERYVSPESSAIDALREVAEVETAYGGGFVNSINGVNSKYTGTSMVKQDWFFYINGIFANVGGLEYKLSDGDVEQWDFHNWNFKTHVTATIGFFPEPFLHGYGGEVRKTIVVYEENLEEEARLVARVLTELGVENVSTLDERELSSDERGGSNLIILGTIGSKTISELNEIHERLGLHVYFKGSEMVVLDSKGQITEQHANGGVIQASQNPWNPKGTMASENVVWTIVGIDEEDLKNTIDVLIERRSEFQYSFAVTMVEDQICRIP